MRQRFLIRCMTALAAVCDYVYLVADWFDDKGYNKIAYWMRRLIYNPLDDLHWSMGRSLRR